MSKKIIYLVDKKSYIEKNCYQSQLFSAIRSGYEVKLVELLPSNLLLVKKYFKRLDSYDEIISVVRLRHLFKYLSLIRNFSQGIKFKIYDQDPWENYINSSPIKGIYQLLKKNLNLSDVFVTAPFWAKKLQSDGIPAKFVRMGMLPGYCDPGSSYENRQIKFGFCGTVHEHRALAFNKLKQINIDIEIHPPNLRYKDYLSYLQKVKIFFHDESEIPWNINNELISRSTSCWIKSVEVASRGTFCIRNFHDEGHAYNLSKIPLIKCYENLYEIPNIINEIESISTKSRRDLQIESVEQIRKQYDWYETAHTLVTGDHSLKC